MNQSNAKKVALIVAHPDDETLWAGGTILDHPSWECFIVCLCRGSDSDRAPRFYDALKFLNSKGVMGDLDDGPEQEPLNEVEVEKAILDLLPPEHFDLIITHNLSGEYTKHLRHEETSKAVKTLWNSAKISADELWTFAYDDGDKKYFPRPIKNATIFRTLKKSVWQDKYKLITEIYAFGKESWEAETTPKAEAFWRFRSPSESQEWLVQFNNGANI